MVLPHRSHFYLSRGHARACNCSHWTPFNQAGGETFRTGARNHCGIVGAQGWRRHEEGEIFGFSRLFYTLAQIKIGGNPTRHDQAERVAAAIAWLLTIDLAEAAHGMAGLDDQTIADSSLKRRGQIGHFGVIKRRGFFRRLAQRCFQTGKRKIA